MLLGLPPRRLVRHLSTLPLLHSQCRPQTTCRVLRRVQLDTRLPQSHLSGCPARFCVAVRFLSTQPDKKVKKKNGAIQTLIRENIYTIPNALTLSRILACPFLALSIVHDNFAIATGILAYAAVSDLVDGFLARQYQMHSVLGTVLDPAADKTVMTTLTVTLAMKGLVPVPLACIIIGRDVLLSIAAFYIRYRTLPAPKTFHRYWDFSIPSAEVHPTRISKINTAIQLLLMGITTISPLVTFDIRFVLTGLQWTVAGTTIGSGLSYVFSTTAVRVVTSKSFRRKP